MAINMYIIYLYSKTKKTHYLAITKYIFEHFNAKPYKYYRKLSKNRVKMSYRLDIVVLVGFGLSNCRSGGASFLGMTRAVLFFQT
jgi:hypothetical protein